MHPSPINRQDGRQEICFDFDWRFLLECPGASVRADSPEFDDRGWEIVQTPHDFSIGRVHDRGAPGRGAAGYLPGGVGWYRKRFPVADDLSDRHVYVEFDGIYRNSDVWCNGHLLGHRHYGYSSFRYELTGHLLPGAENVLAVRADNSDQPNCRWYPGSGIYRHVRLVVTNSLTIEPWGVYVTTNDALARTSTVRVRTTVGNARQGDSDCLLRVTVADPQGRRVAADECSLELPAGGCVEADQSLYVDEPQPWSPDSPALYVATCELCEGERVVDSVRTRFGIRDIEFDPEHGFLLNGEVTKLKGGNVHHDGGCVGAAVPEAVCRRRLRAVKSLGANAVRTSHNPPAPEFLDICDELGLLVFDEAFDKWHAPLPNLPWLDRIHATFHEDWQADLDAMLLRDRNHPCVIIWSVGNEVIEYADPEQCLPIYRRLAERVRAVDPTRPVTMALQYLDHRQQCLHESGLAEAMDLICLNYQEQDYSSDRAQRPDRLILGTETLAYYGIRWQSRPPALIPHRNPWWHVVENDYVIGGLIWPIIDYLGEAGWPRNGYCTGLIDTCGWPKPRSNFFQCAWSEEPEVRIQVRDDSLPLARGKTAWDAPRMACHWNWPAHAGDVVYVHTPTNCETVELLLNGNSRGIRLAADFPNNTVEWHVPYEPGVLEAVGRNSDREVARWQLETSGPPVALQVLPDRSSLSGDGHDAVHVEVRVVDAEGRLVPDHDVDVGIDVTGPGEFLGMDNGYQVSKEPFSSPRRKTYFGRCLAVVRARRGTGTIGIRATSDELEADECRIVLQQAEYRRDT